MRYALAALLIAWPSVVMAYGPLANPQCVTGAATGTTYYACDCQTGAQAGCTAGSNAAAGTSPATAWQTWEKMRTQIVAANNGDRFLLCQGGNFGVTNTSITNTTLTNVGGGVAISSYAAAWGGGGGTGAHWQGAQTLATWNGATGFDGHSLTTNPAFLSLTSPYSLAFLNTSPLYNAGSTANGSATDILGVTRPQSTATDIGAYELLVGIPTPAAPGRNRPIAYGGWFLLMLFVLAVGACAGALSVKRGRAALAEGEHVHLIDEHTTLALEEMRRDGIGLPVNEHCEVCVRRMFGERKG